MVKRLFSKSTKTLKYQVCNYYSNDDICRKFRECFHIKSMYG